MSKKYQSFATPAIRAAYRKVGLRVLPLGELILSTDSESHHENPVNTGVLYGFSAGQKVTESRQNLFLRKIEKKSRKRIVYKVCKQIDGKLISARFGNELTYNPIGQWTHAPKGTRIFTFETLKEAKAFYKPSTEVILKAEVVDGIKGYGAYSTYSVDRFWELFNKFNKSKHPNKAIKKVNKLISVTQYEALLVSKIKLLSIVD